MFHQSFNCNDQIKIMNSQPQISQHLRNHIEFFSRFQSQGGSLETIQEDCNQLFQEFIKERMQFIEKIREFLHQSKNQPTSYCPISRDRDLYLQSILSFEEMVRSKQQYAVEDVIRTLNQISDAQKYMDVIETYHKISKFEYTYPALFGVIHQSMTQPDHDLELSESDMQLYRDHQSILKDVVFGHYSIASPDSDELLKRLKKHHDNLLSVIDLYQKICNSQELRASLLSMRPVVSECELKSTFDDALNRFEKHFMEINDQTQKNTHVSFPIMNAFLLTIEFYRQYEKTRAIVNAGQLGQSPAALIEMQNDFQEFNAMIISILTSDDFDDYLRTLAKVMELTAQFVGTQSHTPSSFSPAFDMNHAIAELLELQEILSVRLRPEEKENIMNLVSRCIDGSHSEALEKECKDLIHWLKRMRQNSEVSSEEAESESDSLAVMKETLLSLRNRKDEFASVDLRFTDQLMAKIEESLKQIEQGVSVDRIVARVSMIVKMSEDFTQKTQEPTGQFVKELSNEDPFPLMKVWKKFVKRDYQKYLQIAEKKQQESIGSLRQRLKEWIEKFNGQAHEQNCTDYEEIRKEWDLLRNELFMNVFLKTVQNYEQKYGRLTGNQIQDLEKLVQKKSIDKFCKLYFKEPQKIECFYQGILSPLPAKIHETIRCSLPVEQSSLRSETDIAYALELIKSPAYLFSSLFAQKEKCDAVYRLLRKISETHNHQDYEDLIEELRKEANSHVRKPVSREEHLLIGVALKIPGFFHGMQFAKDSASVFDDTPYLRHDLGLLNPEERAPVTFWEASDVMQILQWFEEKYPYELSYQALSAGVKIPLQSLEVIQRMITEDRYEIGLVLGQFFHGIWTELEKKSVHSLKTFKMWSYLLLLCQKKQGSIFSDEIARYEALQRFTDDVIQMITDGSAESEKILREVLDGIGNHPVIYLMMQLTYDGSKHRKIAQSIFQEEYDAILKCILELCSLVAGYDRILESEMPKIIERCLVRRAEVLGPHVEPFIPEILIQPQKAVVFSKNTELNLERKNSNQP